MRRKTLLIFPLALTLLHTTSWNLRSQTRSAEPGDVSRWKTFANKAGWQIKYPDNWQVGSCRQCTDPTDPDVFVSFYNPATKELIMIEHLIDKPSDRTLQQWLDDIKKTTNLNPIASEEWITVAGTRALKVINRNRDATESENIYIVHGSKTFAIRTERSTPSYKVYERMLSTFRFTF